MVYGRSCRCECSGFSRLGRLLVGILFLGSAFLGVESPLLGNDPEEQGSISFRRDILPIFSEHCARCHGADEATREGGIRFDERESAVSEGYSGSVPIVPGDSAASELMARISSDDPSLVMPPPEENKPLSREQIDALRKWIDEGAEYEVHWAFEPPRPFKGPAGKSGSQVIDWIVGQHHQKHGLQFSESAELGTLVRRIYLDLIGVPPSLADLELAFDEGIEKTVDRLLGDHRYGEKWARHWLDAARYSDTNGYEKDLRRQQWIWRDWVVEAINQDMPYDQFIIEQIAGDLLPDATQEQVIATGFLRNSMLNEEGAIIPEEFRLAEQFDRMDCIGKSILGLTIQCAQCHTHKFDPITHDDYFGIFAFLNDVHEGHSWVYTQEQLEKIQSIEAAMNLLDEQAKSRVADWKSDLEAWASSILDRESTWETVRMERLESLSGLNHPTQEPDGSILMLGHTSNDVFFESSSFGADFFEVGATGVRLEVLTHGDLPFRGPGRGGKGEWDIQAFEVWLKKDEASDWVRQQIADVVADAEAELVETEEGKKGFGPARLMIDGKDGTAWRVDRGTARRNSPSVAVFRLAEPIEAEEGAKLKFVMRMGTMVGRCRISLTKDSEPYCASYDYEAVQALKKDRERWSGSDWQAVLAAWRSSQPEMQDLQEEYESLLAQFPEGFTSVFHLMARSDESRRVTHLLERGEWDRPMHLVSSKTLDALHPNSEDRPDNRLGLAMWLVDRDSPLAGRVAVNRVWQAIFGLGLVETSDDFGTRAPEPEYLDLLDALAVEFMDRGWSQKALIRQIVLSRTYQQSPVASKDLLERDPTNRLLARGPRFRADAEVVRDIVLSVSGLLHHRLGGPPIIPPVPQSVLDYNFTYPDYWIATTGPERYRRSLYVFRKRSMPDPVMSGLDSPNGDSSCVIRVRSNTPLAALAGLNETIFVEAARAFALRILREGGETDEQRLEYAMLKCVARKPTFREKEILGRLMDSHRERFSQGWLDIRAVTTGDPERLPDLPEGITPLEAGVWTIVARVLLNMDETISKN